METEPRYPAKLGISFYQVSKRLYFFRGLSTHLKGEADDVLLWSQIQNMLLCLSEIDL